MRIGILGGGQLGWMLVLAGRPLGLRFRVLDPNPEAPAGTLARHVVAEYSDPQGVKLLVKETDVVTFEFENVPAEAAEIVARERPLYPPVAALEAAQDRLAEKECLRRLGIPTAPYAPVSGRDELRAAVERLGLPAVLKTRRFGYDGKGQVMLRATRDVDPAWRALGGVPLLLEGFVDFQRELSIIGVRARSGEMAFYPLVENHHAEGILRLSLAPAPGLTPELQDSGEEIARRVMTELNYVGVLAVELFQAGGRLLANEMAPRVHNSGHWTIEGAETSQFENHLRAVVDWPLGSTAPRGHAAMLNLIGHVPEPAAVLRQTGAHLHLYGKAPRPGRKLGHITLRADAPDTLRDRVERVRSLF